MKSISAYEGFRGLYEIFPECFIVTVFKDGYEYKKEFGFSIRHMDEANIEYIFRQQIDNHISQRPRIYKDLKMRFSKPKIDITSPIKS